MSFLCILPVSLHAQSDPVDTLRTVIVHDSLLNAHNFKNDFAGTGTSKQFIHLQKHALINETVSSLLEKQSGVFVKQHGVNALNTMTVRGASAAQSQLIWEGVPLNAPSTGIADLSLVQSGLMDNIELQYGGNSSLYGSGNVGGALLLSHQALGTRHTKAKVAVASFGSIDAFLSHNQPFTKGYLSLRGFYQSAKSDFPYWNNRNQLSYLSNAQRASKGMMFNGGMTIPLFSKEFLTNIQYSSWLQSSERAIPPATFEPFSVKQQQDDFWRNVLQLQQPMAGGLSAQLTLAYFKERYTYSDAMTWQDQSYNTHQWYAEFAIKKTIRKLNNHWAYQYMITMPVKHVQMYVEQEESAGVQSSIALAGFYKLLYKDKLTIQGNARIENVSTISKMPIVGGIAGNYTFKNWTLGRWQIPIYAKMGVQQSFRYPSLNELYVFPGGNERLRPEHGWNREVGLGVGLEKPDDYRWRMQVVYFNRTIHDWIYWLGGSLWTPYNIAKVQTGGWDWQMNWSHTLNNKWRYEYQIDYTYTIATTVASALPNNQSVGKQLPYTPRYVWRNNWTLYYDSYSINVHHQYVGYRFITLDESAYLPPYSYVDIIFKGYLQGKVLSNWQLGAGVYNVLNNRYELAYGRPMPGRNYQLSLQYLF